MGFDSECVIRIKAIVSLSESFEGQEEEDGGFLLPKGDSMWCMLGSRTITTMSSCNEEMSNDKTVQNTEKTV